MTILKVLEQHLYGGFLLVAVGLYFYHAIKREGDRKWMVEYAEQNLGAKLYKSMLKSALDKLDGFWSNRYWSGRLYDFNLLTAIIYPIAFMLAFWFFQNAPTRFGEDIILESKELWYRSLVFLLTCASIFLLLKSKKYLEQGQYFLSKVILSAAIVTSVGVASVVGIYAGDAAIVAAVVAVGAGSTFISFNGAAAIGAVVFCSAALAVNLAIIVNTTAVTLFVVTSFVASVAILAAAIFSVYHCFVILNERSTRKAYLFLSIFIIFFIIGFIVLSRGFVLIDTNPYRIPMHSFVILAIFPLINATFDFVSYGMTRWLLKISLHSAAWKSLFLSLFDFIVGCILLIVFAIFLTILIQGINYLSGIQIYDLEAVFSDMKKNSRDYLWLYAMLLSTLLPTVLHFVIATFNFITLIPQGVWKVISNCVKGYEHSLFKHIGAALGYTAATSFTFALPCVVVWYAWQGVGLIMNQSNLETVLNFLEIFIF